MKKLLLGLALLLTGMIGVAAQDDEVTLVPYEDPSAGLSAVRPEGWQPLGNGVFARAQDVNDTTLIAIQSTTESREAVEQATLPRLLLDELPDVTAEIETDALSWQVYQTDVEAPGLSVRVAFAFAESDNVVFAPLLQAAPDEFDSLYANVFLPVVESVAPLAEDDVPYIEEDVTFDNGDVTLAGTLTIPEGDGPFPAVVLISGSGPTQRDASIAILGGTMQIFRQLADHLTRAGFAVLRYDDRGVGESGGDLATTTIFDSAGDAASAVDYLRTRDEVGVVGFIGHSEGGLLAPIAATDFTRVDFIVSMAGPSTRLYQVLIEQNRLIQAIQFGSDPETVEALVGLQTAFLDAVIARDMDAIETTLRELTVAQIAENRTPEEQAAITDADIEALVQQTLPQYQSDAFAEYISVDPARHWFQLNDVPVLGIFGELDLQVPPASNAPLLEGLLSNNTDGTVVVIPQANHYFQQAERGTTDEYATLEQEFSEEFITVLLDWLTERFG